MQANAYVNNFTNAEKLLIAVLAIFPIGVLIFSSWMSASLFLSAAISIYILVKAPDARLNYSELSGDEKFWIKLILLTLILPIIAIIISQVLRQVFQDPDYDGPVRFLLAIPVLLVVWKKKLPLASYWRYTFAITLIAIAIALPFLPKTGWVQLLTGRLTTYFVNPIIFGRLSLTFGLLSLLSINLVKKDSWPIILLKIIGTALGVYFSIKSESRSNWIAIPIVFLFFLWLNGPKNKIHSTLWAIVISIVLLGSIYKASPVIQKRITEGISDITNYKMHEINPDTSIGIRISLARMAWHYFKIKPFSGWGENGIGEQINHPEISVYASEFTRKFPAAGFHNEFTNGAVESGVGGLISRILLFFVPMAFFINAWRKGITPRLACIGLTYVLSEFIGSLTLEVFEMMFTTSLYALFVASLMGVVLSELSKTKSTA